ncbi:MAG: YgjV family protein [Cytophagales bacterium]|nr:YgjV family protein [Cytophagales bacterium]
MTFLAISFLCKNMKTLRLLNTIGCLAFVVYGYMLEAYPVMVVNALIVIINFYNLYQLLQEKETA